MRRSLFAFPRWQRIGLFPLITASFDGLLSVETEVKTQRSNHDWLLTCQRTNVHI